MSAILTVDPATSIAHVNEKDDTVVREKNVSAIHVEDMAQADDFLDAVRQATDREHSLGFRQALREYPASFAWAILISFTILMEGYDTYLIGNLYAYPSFAEKYGEYNAGLGTHVIPTKWQLALGDVGVAGNVVGLLLMGPLVDKFGHRKTIMGGLVVMSGCIFTTFFAPNVQILTMSVALNGVPNGLFGILGSAYASEVCPLALRGFLTSFVNICWVIGQIIASGVLYGLVDNTTQWSYRIPFGLQWIWPVPLFLLAYFAPESAWWCVRRGRLAQAERTLQRLSSGSTPEQIRQSLAMMIHTNNIEKAMHTEVSFWDMFKGTNRRRTEICCMTLAAQCWSGQAFAYGSTYFFTQAGFSSNRAYLLNFVASAVAFVGTCISWTLMIWFGRRQIIIWGFTAMALDLLIVGCLDFAKSNSAVWVQAALIVLWLGLYSSSLGPQSFGLAAEVSATRLRSYTIALARLTYHLASLLCNSVEPYLINPTAGNLKGKTAFVWFGTSALTILWCILRMPETKGLTYTELDICFEKKLKAWAFSKAKIDVVEETHEVANQETIRD